MANGDTFAPPTCPSCGAPMVLRATELARAAALEWFDKLWLGRARTLAGAYEWLRSTLPHLPAQVAEMNVAECDELVAAVRRQLVIDLTNGRPTP